jgi:hypothetical protein
VTKPSATKTVAREKIAVWLENNQLKKLRAITAKDGIAIAEQIRRAVDIWLKRKK